MKRGRTKKIIKIRTAGGFASQLLGLLAGIYIGKERNVGFVIDHSPFATGAFYPLAIQDLLTLESELGKQISTRGFKPSGDEIIGKHLDSHPILQNKNWTYEKLVSLIRKLGLESAFSILKRDWKLNHSEIRLRNSPRFVKSVAGGFPVFRDPSVIEEFNRRLEHARLDWIRNEVVGVNVVIHYRIGDKRLTYAKPTTAGDGIIDPTSFQKLIPSFSLQENSRIFVVSDDPEEALKQLSKVNIYAEKNPLGVGFWSDIRLMLSAEKLLCSWSAVSQFVLCIVDRSKTEVFYPSVDSLGRRHEWQVDGCKFFEVSYLPAGDPIYDEHYSPIPFIFEDYK